MSDSSGSGEEGDSQSSTERAVSKLKRQSPIVVLAFAALLVGAAITVFDGSVRFYDWANHEFVYDWRNHEYKILYSLGAGTSYQQFRSKLGPPLFQRSSTHSQYSESIFQRRGYWVQTVSNPQGTVEMFAVTVCDRSLHPTFTYTAEHRQSITLGRSTALPLAHGLGFGLSADVSVSGATANSLAYLRLYGGNPGGYKTYIWGWNGLCPGWQSQLEGWFGLLRAASGSAFPQFSKSLRPRDGGWVRFFEHLPVNTFAQEAPLFGSVDPRRPDMPGPGRTELDGFQVGADRILVRTVVPGIS